MYYKDAEDGRNKVYKRYPWGMLVEVECFRNDAGVGRNRYGAVVLDQVLQDIQSDYRHLFDTLALFHV